MTIKTHTGRRLFKRSTIAACVMAASAAHVQAQEANSDDPALLEEVVVYGIKQSLQNAQDIKRDATTVKDVITASDITSLPDKSVVEALARVPGVVVEKFAATSDSDHFSGEGSAALVRGLNRVRTEFNGRGAFNAGLGGSLNLGDIPPELVKSIEVIKNQTASTTEGGIAGTINIVTRKPLDSDGLVLGGSVKAVYADLIGETSPELSGIFSNSIDTDTGRYGFMLNLSSSEFQSRVEQVAYHNFYERSARGVDASTVTGTDRNGDPIYDNIEPTVDNGFAGQPIANDLNGTYYMPPSVRIGRQDSLRDRLGIAAAVQWESPSEEVLATFEYISSDSKMTWSERAIENADSLGDQVDNRNNGLPLGVNSGSPLDSFGSDGLFSGGVIGSGNGYLALTRAHEEENRIEDYSANIVFNPDNGPLTIETDLQYIGTEASLHDFSIMNRFTSDVAVSGGDTPTMAFLGPDVGTNPLTPNYAALNDLSTYVVRSAMDAQQDAKGKQLAFALDGEYEFDEGFITSVQGGVQFTEREQSIKDADYDWGLVSPEWSATAATLEEFPELAERVDFGSDHADGALGGQTAFYFPTLGFAENKEAFEDYINQPVQRTVDVNGDGVVDENDVAPLNFEAGAAGDPFVSNARQNERVNPGLRPYAPNQIFETSEKRQAAYVQVNFENNDLPIEIGGNVGLRFVNIQLETTGFVEFQEITGGFLNPDQQAPGFENNITDSQNAFLDGSSGPLAASPDDYSTVLPSLNVKFGITDDFLIRFGASKAIFVPELQDIRNGTRISATTLTERVDPNDPDSDYTSVEVSSINASTVGDSNPFLQPEESVNIDLSAEWYFSDVGSLTGVIFTKDIDNLIRMASSRGVYTNPNTGVSEEVIFTSKANVGEATINGFEIAYQQGFDMLPEPFDGLGMQFNYTYLDAEEDVGDDLDTSTFGAFTDLPLEGLSESNYNLVLFYENELFSTRFAYNWRSEYLLNSRDVIAKAPKYNDDLGFLDFSANYNLTDQIKLGFNINNVLNTQTKTLQQVTQAGLLAPRQYIVNDRRFTFSVTGNF
ncbi:TonB-dependent receptor [Marinagarivorans cellulosilyticus]|uniref:TonB-dependent receptor n=1 Tax=Marinagarivorans cellulosilyticus TaxID=2721545 RepID=A0AAN2BIV8_9GAMM|nr:TonB-dependent receptor [Marinagarivorans cellulosilyticus]BCD96318.1 hypothetical protein MARGE09_P0518 [Marinagarivorans cellulosilyticus]